MTKITDFAILDAAYVSVEIALGTLRGYYTRTKSNIAHDAVIALTEALQAVAELVELEERKEHQNAE